MKKTRIFLAASCLVLAIAGVAATKSKDKLINYYYLDTSVSPSVCRIEPTPPTNCSSDPNPPCTDGNGYSVFLQKVDNNTCSTPLFFQ